MKTSLILLSFLAYFLSGAIGEMLESDLITNWGEWGIMDRCPGGTYAYAMQLKTARSPSVKFDRDYDDTALNAIKLFCKKPGESSEVAEITSKEGPNGTWAQKFICAQDGFMNGFQLNLEPNQNGSKINPKANAYNFDDTGANNLIMYCTAGSQEGIKGDGTGWGVWESRKMCKDGEAVSGIQTQVEDYNKKCPSIICGDETGLNNLRVECSKIQVGSEAGTCTPLDKWVTVADCDATMSDVKSCEFKQELGVIKSDGSQASKNEEKELMRNFNANLSPSPSTGVNWKTEVDVESFDPYDFADGVTVNAVGGSRKVYQYVVGTCGSFHVHSTAFQHLIYDSQGILKETKRV